MRSIPMEAIRAAARLLDPDPKHPYAMLKMGGDPKVYEQFAKDVILVAETLAQLVVDEKGKN